MLPGRVTRREVPVVAVPMFARWWDQIREPVEKLKRRKLDNAVAPPSRGLPPTSQADPVGGLVPWEHVANLGDAAGWAADHGESLEREGRPGAIPQQVFERLTIDTQLGATERDADARV